jgi:MOSC domain-containing protein YiiM
VNPTVVAIYTTATAGAPLHAAASATLAAGKGLVGDRYYAGVGKFSTVAATPDSEITLIESEEIQRFNELEKASRSPGEFRRNIVTAGIRLNDLVGRRFSVGAAVLEGMRLCEPCAYLARLVSPAVVQAMVHRAGLRARVVAGAVIRPGDKIQPRDAP